MAYFLAITLTALTVIVYTIGKQRVVSPSMLFLIPFSFSAFWLTLNITRWSVVLNYNTIMVIVGGCLSFLLGIMVASPRMYKIKTNVPKLFKRKDYNDESRIPDHFFLIILIVEAIVFALAFRSIRSIVHRYGYSGNIAYEIYSFRNIGMYTTDSTSLGQGLDWAYQFNMSSAYIWIYIFMWRIKHKKKLGKTLPLCIVVSLLTGLIKGGRQSAIQIISAGLVYYLLLMFSERKSRKLPLKSVLKIIGIVVLMAVTFQTVGTMLGRTVQADFMQYLAVYLSGGIRNLNEWLKSSHELPEVFGKMTFATLYPYLGRKFGISNWVYVLDLPYLSANGHNSGNIYTTFYAFIYDFGYVGIFIMPFIMGIVSELSYKSALRARMNSEFNIDIGIILYGFIAYLLVFSFFSNKFYEGIVKQSFIKYLLFWIILSYAINRMHRLTVHTQ